MSMDSFLAQFFGTAQQPAAASQEDLQKQATVDLFLKVASDQKIDVASMPDDKVAELYIQFMTQMNKQAESKEEKKEEKLEEEAKKEHEEKKEAASKLAEAIKLGQVMAHSFVKEVREKLAEPGELPPFMKKEHEGKEEKKDEKKEEKKEHEKEAMPQALKAGVEQLRADQVKSASAIDRLAAVKAVSIAKEAQYDEAQASRRVAAVLELGLQGESTKVASAPNIDAATHIRALEILEKAGYPVNWDAK
jgi:hypothetical protein